MTDKIKLADGSGKGLSAFLNQHILPALDMDGSAALEDAAVLAPEDGSLVFTTDSFTVTPLEFNGGDIGKLAACGTINDLAMMGAVPRFISLGLIIEEGLETDVLVRMLTSFTTVCRQSNVRLVCGDTKVVERGKADRLFINTSGIGFVRDGLNISAANAKPSDAVIVSGPIGRHGIAVLAARKNLGFASDTVSDCAPLNNEVCSLLSAVPRTRTLRDATRGGCAAVLNEIADSSSVTITLKSHSIPVSECVASACSFLGFEPIQIANEGTFVAVVPPDQTESALKSLSGHPQTAQAAVIGTVGEQQDFNVLLETPLGGLRPVDNPPGRLLPRIC